MFLKSNALTATMAGGLLWNSLAFAGEPTHPHSVLMPENETTDVYQTQWPAYQNIQNDPQPRTAISMSQPSLSENIEIFAKNPEWQSYLCAGSLVFGGIAIGAYLTHALSRSQSRTNSRTTSFVDTGLGIANDVLDVVILSEILDHDCGGYDGGFDGGCDGGGD